MHIAGEAGVAVCVKVSSFMNHNSGILLSSITRVWLRSGCFTRSGVWFPRPVRWMSAVQCVGRDKTQWLLCLCVGPVSQLHTEDYGLLLVAVIHQAHITHICRKLMFQPSGKSSLQVLNSTLVICLPPLVIIYSTQLSPNNRSLIFVIVS